MPWSAHVEGSPPIVCSRYQGRLALAELHAMATETVRLAAERGARLFLGDTTELEPNDSVVDVYEMVALLDRILADRSVREALLVPRHPEAAAQVRFYETACLNRGVAVRVFEDRDEAMRWLLAEPG